MKLVAQSLLTVLFVLLAAPAFAQSGAASEDGLIAVAAGLAIGVAAFGGALGQGKAAAAALEGLARNPEAKVMGPMILGLALIESLVIYALIIAFQLAGKVG